MFFARTNNAGKDGDGDADDGAGGAGGGGGGVGGNTPQPPAPTTLEELDVSDEHREFLRERLCKSVDIGAASGDLRPAAGAGFPVLLPIEGKTKRGERDDGEKERGRQSRPRQRQMAELPDLDIRRTHADPLTLARLGTLPAHTPDPYGQAVTNALVALHKFHMASRPSNQLFGARDMFAEIRSDAMVRLLATFRTTASQNLDPSHTILDIDVAQVRRTHAHVIAHDPRMLDAVITDSYSALLLHMGGLSTDKVVALFVNAKGVLFSGPAWNHVIMAYTIARPRVLTSTDPRERLLMTIWATYFYGFLDNYVLQRTLIDNTMKRVHLRAIQLLRGVNGGQGPPAMITSLLSLFAMANHIGFTPLSQPVTRLPRIHVTTRESPDTQLVVRLASELRWLDTFATVISLLHETRGDEVDPLFVDIALAPGGQEMTVTAREAVPSEYAGSRGDRAYREGLAQRRRARIALWVQARRTTLQAMSENLDEMEDHMQPLESMVFYRLAVDRWASLVDDVFVPGLATKRLRDTRIHAWQVATQIVRMAAGKWFYHEWADIPHPAVFALNPSGDMELPLSVHELPVVAMLAIWLSDPYGDLNARILRILMDEEPHPVSEPLGLYELSALVVHQQGASPGALTMDPRVLQERRLSAHLLLQASEEIRRLDSEIGRIRDAQSRLVGLMIEKEVAVARAQVTLESFYRLAQATGLPEEEIASEMRRAGNVARGLRDAIEESTEKMRKGHAAVDGMTRQRAVLQSLINFNNKTNDAFVRLEGLDDQLEVVMRNLARPGAAGEPLEALTTHREALETERRDQMTIIANLVDIPIDREDLTLALRNMKRLSRTIPEFGSHTAINAFKVLFQTFAKPLMDMRALTRSDQSARGILAPPGYEPLVHRAIVEAVWLQSASVSGAGPGRILIPMYMPLPATLSTKDQLMPHVHRALEVAHFSTGTRVRPLMRAKLASVDTVRPPFLSRPIEYIGMTTTTTTTTTTTGGRGVLVDPNTVHNILAQMRLQPNNLLGMHGVISPFIEQVWFHYDIFQYNSRAVDYYDYAEKIGDRFHPAFHETMTYILRMGLRYPPEPNTPAPSRSKGARELMAALSYTERVEYKNRPLVLAWVSALMGLLNQGAVQAMNLRTPPQFHFEIAARKLAREEWEHGKPVSMLRFPRMVQTVLARRLLVKKYQLLGVENPDHYRWFNLWWAVEVRRLSTKTSESRHYRGSPVLVSEEEMLVLEDDGNRDWAAAEGVTRIDESSMMMNMEENWRMAAMVVLWNTSKISARLQTLAVDMLHYLHDDLEMPFPYYENPYATQRSDTDAKVGEYLKELATALKNVYPARADDSVPEMDFFAEVVWPLWIREDAPDEDLGVEKPSDAVKELHVNYRQGLWRSELTRVRFLTQSAKVVSSWGATKALYLHPSAPSYGAASPGLGYRQIATVALLALIHEEFLENPDVGNLDYEEVLYRFREYFIEPLQVY